MEVTTAIWTITIACFLGLFLIDFLLVDARPHVFKHSDAVKWVILYVVLALVFAAAIWLNFGKDYGQQFLAGWITEYSLSVDNLFVFIVLMSSFAVPQVLKHRVLLIGVLLAIFLRTILIVLGSEAIQRFEATFFVFAAFLLYTAISVWRSKGEEADPEGNSFVRLVAKVIPTSRDYDGAKYLTKVDGRRAITPLFLVILAVGTTDLLFALDSIPAVFGLTKEPYLVFAANAFALMGLRQLYFLLDGLLAKIVYLSKGLAVILGFISVKLFLEALGATTEVHVPHVEIAASLMFIAGTLGVTIFVSLWAVRRNPALASRSEIAEALEESQEHKGQALDYLADSPTQDHTDADSQSDN